MFKFTNSDSFREYDNRVFQQLGRLLTQTASYSLISPTT